MAGRPCGPRAIWMLLYGLVIMEGTLWSEMAKLQRIAEEEHQWLA